MTCKGLTKAGKPCKFHAEENGYCKHHQAQLSAPKESPRDQLAYAKAAARREVNRKQRDEMGSLPGQTLIGGQKDGFVRRWVTNEAANLDRKLSKGYSFVDNDDAPTTNIGSVKSHITGTQKSGETQLSFLMEIPEGFHTEDQQEKERQIARMQGDALNPEMDAPGLGSGPEGSTRYDPFKDPSSKHYRSG